MKALAIVTAIGILGPVETGRAATPAIAAGASHTVALQADGSARAWGSDESGQLASGTSLASAMPVQVTGLPPLRTDARSIAANLVIAADGSVWAWGGNFWGQLGDGTFTTRSTPVRVIGLSDAVAVAAGESVSAAVTASGEVWGWGATPGGARRTTPAQVRGMPPAAAVSAGMSHVLVLDRDGTVWGFGDNSVGQLGDGTTTTPTAPVRVQGLSGVIAIASTRHHNLALRGDGSVWAWGLNDLGQLGDATTTNRAAPVQVRGLAGVTGISASSEPASVALTADGRVWRWGRARLPTPTPGVTPEPIPGFEAARQVAAGFFVAALRADGSVWTQGNTGDFALGRAGDGNVPGPVGGLAGVSAIAAGAGHLLAVLSDGRLFAWGSNANGVLGTGRRVNQTTPQRVTGVDSVVQVAAGAHHSVFLRSDGTVAESGMSASGAAVALPLAGLAGIVQVAAGNRFSLALKGDGTVWSWGSNEYGQLARGTVGGADGGTPGPVPSLAGVVRVAAAGHRAMAVRSDGTVWAWGRADENTLGVPATATCRVQARDEPCTPQPTRVAGIDSVIDIAMSHSHALALRADRGVWAWGNNFVGALGDDTTGSIRPTPAPVVGLAGVRQVAAAGIGQNPTSVALKTDGSVWTWGSGSRGQLGSESSGRTPAGTPFRPKPGRVEGLGGITHIAAGGSHLLAVRNDGVVLGWGANPVGQVGDGTVADQVRPVIVLRENGAGSLEAGDWFLDLDPGVSAVVALDKAFALVAEGSVGETEANVSAQIRVRAADAGRTGNVYVFALAPQERVRPAADGAEPLMLKVTVRGKDLPVSCVLAQLNATGQLQAVSAAALQAYVSGVLSAQAQPVTILNGVPVASIGGATFFVGYGTSGTAMLNGGTNRSAASAPAPSEGAVECRPVPPATGWWWNPAEDGRGYSIERRGNSLFFASFLYDVSGRSTWLVASGPVSLEGALFTGDLLEVRGGQTLGGAYPGFPSNVRSVGPITLAFNAANEATMAWPGGNVPIRRFDIVPNGLAAGPAPNMPEAGWWWNEQESGRGFFLEWQGNMLDIAGYMYDEAGNPVWYITVGPTAADGRTFSGTWWSYGNGMTLMGPWRPHVRVNDNVAPVTITFTSTTTATMTLPNGRTTNLARHRF